MSAPQLLHAALGHPAPKWPLEPHEGRCLTCGEPITEGVEFERRINLKTFSNHTVLTRWGTHACAACAWLYSDAKSKHKAWAVAGSQAWWPVINTASVTPERPQWLTVLEAIAGMPPETPVALLLTTDPKPRLWHNVIVTSPTNPLAYLHNPDLDVSDNVRLDLPETIRLTRLVAHAQALGFSKISAYHGLTREYPRLLKHAPDSLELERSLSTARGTRELQVAVTIAQKEHHLGA